MAVSNFDSWVPETWGGDVVNAVQRTSVVINQGRHDPIGNGDVRHVPRAGEMDVHNIGKGGTYTADGSVNDEVTLTSRKLGTKVNIAEEDLRDSASAVDIVNAKKTSWATSFAKYYDNATLGVSGTESSTDSDDRPYTSVYKLVRSSNTNLDPDYSADDNYTNANLASSGANYYDTLRTAAKKYERGSYFDHSETIVVAAPEYIDVLRGIKDTQNRPIFIETAGVDQTAPPVTSMGALPAPMPGVKVGTLFTYPMFITQGAKTSPAAKHNPTGRPLLIFCNRRHLINGDKWPAESQVVPASVNASSDDITLKMRYRGGFAGGHPSAFSVLEDNTGA